MRAQAPVEKKYYARARFHRSVRFRNRPVRNLTLTPLNNRKNHRRQVTDSVMAQSDSLEWQAVALRKSGQLFRCFSP